MKNVFIIVSLAFILTGCRSSWTTETLRSRPEIDLKLEQEAKQVNESAKKIDDLSNDRQVEQETVKLKSVSTSLLQKAEKNLHIDAYVKKVEDKLIEYENDQKRRVNTIFLWMLSGGCLLIIAGIAVIVFGSQAGMSGLGIQLLAIGATLVGVSYTMIAYPWIALTIGVAVFSFGMLYFLWKYVIVQKRLFKTSGELQSTDEALKDSIRSVEAVKQLGWNTETKQVLNTIQSPKSKQLIGKIRTADKN
jgi:outer membrane murein-binding lipoprotein Lpp